MSGAIILENVIDRDWWHRLDVLANTEKELEPFRDLVPAVGSANINIFKEAGAWHLRAYAPMRSRLDLEIPLGVWPILAWWIGDSKVSAAMVDGGAAYCREFGDSKAPIYAFIKKIPATTTEFVEVKGIILVRADWVPANYIALARGGTQVLNGGKQWKKI